MDNLKTNIVKKGVSRNMIIIIAVVVVALIAYIVFFKKDDSAQTGGLTTLAGDTTTPGAATSDVQVTSQQFLTELLNIDSINIDNSIVTNPAFVVLKDRSLPIDPDNDPGRINPFAPIGAENQVVSTQIQTNNPTLQLATSVVLNGTLLIAGKGITRWFEYGTTDDLGTKTSETPQSNIGAFSQSVGGLIPDTKYYVKAFASLNGQVLGGELQTWQTAPLKRSTQ